MTEILSESRFGITSPVMLFLISLTTFLTVYYWWQQTRRYYKMGNGIPGPATLPFIGNALSFIGKSNNQILETALRLGKPNDNISRAWFGSKLMVFLSHPDDIEIILNSKVHLDKSPEYRFFQPWLGDGLLLASGDRWRYHRKLIAPAFHQNVLKSFIPTFNSNSHNVVEKFRKEIGTVFDVHDYMSETTVDILLETAMGVDRTDQNREGFDYAMAVMKMCDIIHLRHTKLYLMVDSLFNLTSLKSKQKHLLGIIHKLTKKVIKTKNEEFDQMYSEGQVPSPSLSEIIANENFSDEDLSKTTKTPSTKTGLRDDLDENDENDIGEKRRFAFLDLMIEAAKSGAKINNNDIKEQVDTIMFEGHDTTAAGSSFVLCLLGIHHEIQDRVYREIKQIFGDSDRDATFADTLEMKYLERVIMETLRMYPPVPVIARQINEDVRLPSENVVAPAGCTVVVATLKLHRREDIYENPNVFDPDNFLPERTAKRHYYSYIPFSAGPRSCVGRKYAMLKLKILLSTILRNYRIKSDLTEEDFKLQADIILKRSDGFRIEIEPRVK